MPISSSGKRRGFAPSYKPQLVQRTALWYGAYRTASEHLVWPMCHLGTASTLLEIITRLQILIGLVLQVDMVL